MYIFDVLMCRAWYRFRFISFPVSGSFWQFCKFVDVWPMGKFETRKLHGNPNPVLGAEKPYSEPPGPGALEIHIKEAATHLASSLHISPAAAMNPSNVLRNVARAATRRPCIAAAHPRQRLLAAAIGLRVSSQRTITTAEKAGPAPAKKEVKYTADS
jgi:hypothetical protein